MHIQVPIKKCAFKGWKISRQTGVGGMQCKSLSDNGYGSEDNTWKKTEWGKGKCFHIVQTRLRLWEFIKCREVIWNTFCPHLYQYPFPTSLNCDETLTEGLEQKMFHKNIINFWTIPICSLWPGSSVGIATGYGLDGPRIESRWSRDFPHLFRPALGPTQPPVQWVPGLSRG